ncbi:MAG: alpha-E domain-containing protein, partial [Steroidobacteraceae bacterium]
MADNLYWLARYLERTENLARLVDVNANLMLDLPKELAPGWQPVITITGSQSIFTERYKDTSERSVVRFVVADDKNPGSMVTSLAHAREIARTIRDILPREVWEHVNELFLYVNEHASEAINKRTRYAFLKRVTLGIQTLTGMFEGIVNEGASLGFLTLGRNLERADMTSRIVDVRAAVMLPDEVVGLRPFATVEWMSVLNSLSGYHMYRLKMRERVHPAGVVRFLLADDEFPRACVCCLKRAEAELASLPRSDAVLKRLARMRRAIVRTPFETMSQKGLH